MTEDERAIAEMVHRETRAWNTQDAELLLSLFHPDMVWPWPRTSASHDPVEWEFVLGRFDRKRWGDSWRALFASHRLVHNRRQIVKIVVTPEGDGAFAVVDIDTLWERADEGRNHWQGRVCKVYAKVDGAWKITMHTGALQYPTLPRL